MSRFLKSARLAQLALESLEARYTPSGTTLHYYLPIDQGDGQQTVNIAEVLTKLEAPETGFLELYLHPSDDNQPVNILVNVDPASDTRLSKLTIDGGRGDDLISVTGDSWEAQIVINGKEGDDLIKGSGHAEQIYGGPGDDRIDGGSGRNQIWGGDGNDILSGGIRCDRIWGGNGNDKIVGGPALLANNEADLLWGEGGNDAINDSMAVLPVPVALRLPGATNSGAYIDGGIGNDTILGSSLDDVAKGGDGNDSVWGLAGNDILYGGKGADRVYGGDGSDTIYGNDGTRRAGFGWWDNSRDVLIAGNVANDPKNFFFLDTAYYSGKERYARGWFGDFLYNFDKKFA